MPSCATAAAAAVAEGGAESSQPSRLKTGTNSMLLEGRKSCLRLLGIRYKPAVRPFGHGRDHHSEGVFGCAFCSP